MKYKLEAGFRWISDQIGCSPSIAAEMLAALRGRAICLLGYGSIARPAAELLASWGVQDFTLIDPKRYRPSSMHSQCAASEVGALKVDVGREVLGKQAQVKTFARDAFEVPDGIVGTNSLVVATVDNRRADIRANRLARTMKSLLVKVNVEPAFDACSIRVFDFRGDVQLCAECQFTEQHYRSQRHPRSCDAEVNERQTNSPRWLSETAAQAAALVIAQIAGGRHLDKIVDSEWLFNAQTKRALRSTLVGNANCRFDHASCWENVERLEAGPGETRLCDLLSAAESADATLHFCQQVAVRGRCGNCFAECERVRWTTNLHQPMCDCPYCGAEEETGKIFPIPYWSFSQLSAAQLQSVLHVPLANWGVEPQAVIGIRHGNALRTVIVGDEQRDSGDELHDSSETKKQGVL